MSNIQYNKEDNSITISWSLFDLPTAQHKAGLAGLYAYASRHSKIAPGKPAPTLEATATELQVCFTKEAFKSLFDDLYAGEYEEYPSAKELKDTKPKRTETRDGKVFHVYERLAPAAKFIRYFRNNDPGDPWVKLWRSAVRGVLRAGGGTEKIFAQPKESAFDGSNELKGLWEKCLKAGRQQEARAASDKVPTAVYIGAESTTAEKIKFKGDITHNLLLHFWCLVAPIYQLRVVEFQKKNSAKSSFQGYIWVVPEVAGLREFDHQYSNYIKGRDPEALGKIPKHAIIDAQAEGALNYVYSLAQQKIPAKEEIAGMDIYHLVKRGNNVKMLFAENMPLTGIKRMLDRYQRIADGKNHFLFKRLLIENLLNARKWYENFAAFSASIPAEFFISSKGTPARLNGFGKSANKKFQEVIQDLANQEGQNMDPAQNKNTIPKLIYEIVGKFVNSRAEKRSGVSYGDLAKGDDGKPNWASKQAQDFSEAREKVAMDAFLAIRSRNPEEFVAYFTNTICSVGQHIRDEEFMALAEHVQVKDCHENFKNLTMLALSARAYRPFSSKQQEGETQ